jgi:hypothetical protein
MWKADIILYVNWVLPEYGRNQVVLERNTEESVLT